MISAFSAGVEEEQILRIRLRTLQPESCGVSVRVGQLTVTQFTDMRPPQGGYLIQSYLAIQDQGRSLPSSRSAPAARAHSRAS